MLLIDCSRRGDHRAPLADHEVAYFDHLQELTGRLADKVIEARQTSHGGRKGSKQGYLQRRLCIIGRSGKSAGNYLGYGAYFRGSAGERPYARRDGQAVPLELCAIFATDPPFRPSGRRLFEAGWATIGTAGTYPIQVTWAFVGVARAGRLSSLPWLAALRDRIGSGPQCLQPSRHGLVSKPPAISMARPDHAPTGVLGL